MNDTLHGWVATLLSLPIPAWAAIIAVVAGAAIPWLVEANVPMADWSGGRFRLITYGAAALAGAISAITIWHNLSALAMWVPALGVNLARDIASHFLPWLSPRQQQVVVRRDAQGQVVAIKEGDDPTIVITQKPTDTH